MLVAHTIVPTFAQQFQKWKRNPLPLDVRRQVAQDWRVSKVLCQKNEEKIARIHGMFDKAKLSVSSYDTAWLAMVPSPNSEEKNLFPQCLDWVMNHQHPDGSCCFNPWHPLLLQDSLSSTLACVLGLQKWKVGDLLVERALNFIEKYQWAAADGRQLTPIGFEIVFLGMMEQAIENGLSLPVDSTLAETLLHKRDNEITRCHDEGYSGYLTYLLEGLITKYERKDAMKHQRQNGSLFNSPSAIAASLILRYDDKCYHYLNTILKTYNNTDYLAKSKEQNDFFSSVSAKYNGTDTTLELLKACQVTIYQKEPILEEIKTWTSSFLNQELQSGAIHDRRLREEVQHTLNYKYDSLNRADCRRNIELMDIDNTQLLKTFFSILSINNKDLLSLSVQDYNMCQSLFRQELEESQRWEENSAPEDCTEDVELIFSALKNNIKESAR